MRKDFKIALILAIAAVPAGLAVSEALEYFPFLKENSGVAFWGSSAVTLALIAIAAIVAIRGEREAERAGAKKRMIPLVGMIVFGVGFLACAAWYFWPNTNDGLASRADQRGISTPPAGPLAGLTNAQLRERAIAIAMGLRQLESEYNAKRVQLSFDNFNKMRALTDKEAKSAEFKEGIAKGAVLSEQLEADFRNRFRSDVIILREELRTRLGGTLPMPEIQPFPGVPPDQQIFDKPFLAGPNPLSGGADLLEYWAKQLP